MSKSPVQRLSVAWRRSHTPVDPVPSRAYKDTNLRGRLDHRRWKKWCVEDRRRRSLMMNRFRLSMLAAGGAAVLAVVFLSETRSEGQAQNDLGRGRLPQRVARID